jgi:hypothetical protein
MTTVSSPSESRFSLADAAGPSGVLRLLFWLRMVAIASQLLAIAFVEFLLDTSLPLRELGLTIGALALWNALNYGPVHADRRVQDAEVALHLAVDIAALTSLLYFTGGSTNPFVSLYLVPISLAATSLPARYAWLIGGLCGAGYAFLWRRSVPLPSVDFDLHLTGMWGEFRDRGGTDRAVRRPDGAARARSATASSPRCGRRRCAINRSSSSARSPQARHTSSIRLSRRSRSWSRSSTSARPIRSRRSSSAS